MKKIKLLSVISVIAVIGITLLGCNNQKSKEAVDNTSTGVASEYEESTTQTVIDNSKVNEDNETTDIPDVASKIQGKRIEFIERLDNIQKEIEALPEKKDSDAGITNAMKSYYGKAYEIYDQELNEIYAFLKEQLSSEVINDLEVKQLKWIEEKEAKAREEEAKYKDGTFEFVAGYISLYESTKEKCYELVNDYMTD